MKMHLLFLMTVILHLTSCKMVSLDDQIRCFKLLTEQNKNTEEFKILKKQLNDTIQSWIDKKVYLVQRLKVTNWKIDDAVFYNTKKDKAIFLILEQDTIPNAKMDDTKMIYAKQEDNLWKFYYGGMPSFASMRYYEKKNPEMPYTFKELSDKVVTQVIKGGYFKSNSCKINDDFINDWDKDLEKAHKRFLRNIKL